MLQNSKPTREYEKLEKSLGVVIMDKKILSETTGERRFLIYYVAVASALMMLIVLLQSFKYRIFGTTLLLGWDSPAYVWSAKYVITKGPMNMIDAWSYPYLYTQLLAFFGYLSGDVVMVERVLPLLFGMLMIYGNSKLALGVTKNVHIAGLTALLTAISLNVLRLLSDFHRNLAAFSLSSIVLLLVANIDDDAPFLNKRYLSLIFILLAIASIQLETFFILSVTLVLYGCLIKDLKKLLMLGFACAIPVAILALLFPDFFLGYINTATFFTHRLSFNEIVLWTGGSWIPFGFLITGTFYLFYRTTKRNDKLAPLIFSWLLAIVLVVVSIEFMRIVPSGFALRTLLITPVPVLLALSIPAFNDFFKRIRLKGARSFAKNKYSTRGDVLYIKILLFLLASCLIVGSSLAVFRNCDYFLTPYISHSSYEKMLAARNFLVKNGLSKPIVVFRGDPPIWYVDIYRNYLGTELGEHFAYYGDIENLFHLVPSEPRIGYDPYLSELERHYLTICYNELIGNTGGPPPPRYYHESHIRSLETLTSHPILIVTPEFYNEKIPYCIKPFHIGEGIYVIPPNSSIDVSEVVYGPTITVFRSRIFDEIKSEYLYVDANNPSIVYLRVNGSSGYEAYNFTNFPSYWTFVRIEQDGDLSFPENNPKRVDGTPALNNNDPADSTKDWSIPWVEQNGRFNIDASSKKEGVASLKITGKTDSWSCLGVEYNSQGTWDLSRYSSISVWAKSSEPAIFSISLIDANGRFRAFWYIKTEGQHSATTTWKRFVANLDNHTSQTPGFNISEVDSINLYIESNSVGKNMSFWIDDLMVDIPVDSKSFIYKARVSVDETVVVYFYVDTTHEAEDNKTPICTNQSHLITQAIILSKGKYGCCRDGYNRNLGW